MKKQNNGEIMMPSSCITVSEEETQYLTGGKTLPYCLMYTTKNGAAVGALAAQIRFGYYRISTYDMAAEIYTHALAYYRYGVFLALASRLGFARSVANSILNGIDLENGLDRKTIAGIPRYVFYRAVYNTVI